MESQPKEELSERLRKWMVQFNGADDALSLLNTSGNAPEGNAVRLLQWNVLSDGLHDDGSIQLAVHELLATPSHNIHVRQVPCSPFGQDLACGT